MIVNNKSGLTIVMGREVKRIMNRAFDVLITGGVNQHTYSFERFNTNLKNYVYYALRNNLNDVKDEISGLALSIAGKVVGRELTIEDQSRLVDSFIDALGEQS